MYVLSSKRLAWTHLLNELRECLLELDLLELSSDARPEQDALAEDRANNILLYVP